MGLWDSPETCLGLNVSHRKLNVGHRIITFSTFHWIAQNVMSLSFFWFLPFPKFKNVEKLWACRGLENRKLG